MVASNLEPVKEFSKIYTQFGKVAEEVHRASDRTVPGWTRALDNLLSSNSVKPETAKKAREEPSYRNVDYALSEAANLARNRIQDYFGKNKAEIIGRIDDSKLEKMAFGIKPVSLPKTNPDAEKHNPLVALVQAYQKAEEMNGKIAKEEVSPEEYRAFIIQGAKEILQTALNGDNKAKKLYAEVILQTIARATGSGKIVGKVIQRERMNRIGKYIEQEEPSGSYTVGDFVRNNIMYGNQEQAIDVTGQLLAKKDN